MHTILIENATIINEGTQFLGSVLIKDGKFEEIYTQVPPKVKEKVSVIDASGKILIPGVIDDQVHLREPGLTHKETIETGSLSAIAGGVTSFMEMPNTLPQTTTNKLLEEKFEIAAQKSLANYSFYLGATNDNIEEITNVDTKRVCGIKVFMGSSTGNMLVDNPQSLERIFAKAPILIATHCEDEATIQENTNYYKAQYGENIPIEAHPKIRSEEACYKSSSFAVQLAKKHNTRLHILHLSTAKELELFDNKPLSEKKITAEVCVHHLWFSDKDYADKGTLIKWNPAVKTEKDKNALLQGLLNGKLDIVATDHAPHTYEEKKILTSKSPSGGPLLQHSLLVMLELYHQNKIPLETIVAKMCHAPAELFKVNKRGYIRKGYWADCVLIDLNNPEEVSKKNINYKCEWSPFEGDIFTSKVTHTFVNGHLAYEQGKFNTNSKGKSLTFDR